MDIVLALGVSAAGLVTTVIRGGWIFYPLLLTLGLLGGLYWRRGVELRSLLQMMQAGIGKSLGVISILLLIGALIAAWMAAGTVPALVYYGLQLIQPRLFVLSAFVLTGLVSMLIGTSFGAVGTLGVALMIMARGNALDEHLVAGAIIAGAYVGDRCSPLSSSAHLVATLTQTQIYRNLQIMMRSSLVPLGASLVIYGGLSWRHPLQAADRSIQAALAETFNLHPVALLPAIAILIMVAFRVPVKRTLLASLGLAVALALGLQGYTPIELGQRLVVGFWLDQPAVLAPLLQGGGLLPMGRVCLVVVVSTALAGLLVGTQTLAAVEQWLGRLRSRRSLFAGTLLVSLLTAAYGCTQTIAILLTHQLIEPHYDRAQLNPEQAALDLENTAVVLSPLVPWNLAGLVPAALLTTDAGFIPYAVYLYLLPLFVLIAPAGRGGGQGYSARNFIQDPL